VKGNRIIGPLVTAILISQLLIVIPATPVLAASVNISPSSGPVDETVTITGTGFTANNPYTILFGYGTPFELSVGRGIVSNGGEIPPTSFKVPVIPGGAYPIRVESFGESGEHVSRIFLIVPDIEPDQSYGPVGKQITVDGTGFAAGKNFILFFEDEALGGARTDDTGRFYDATITIPESPRGDHVIRATDELNNYATDSFSTRESITISPTTGAPGTDLTVSGTGFKANRPITISFSGEVISTPSSESASNDKGSFTATVIVPLRPNGDFEVEASDGANKAEASFTVVSGVSLTPTAGITGTELTVAGSGFSGQVTVKYDDEVVATAMTEATGDFSVSFDAPSSTPGTHTITASDGINTKTVTFTMRAKILPVPVPLSPITDTTTKPKPHFGWTDVKDPALAVTYSLQIASDQGFNSVILEKEGLAESEYTVTDEEELKPGGKSAPYYWRVKAVDDAGNESDWSTPQSFYVASTFSLGNWGLYALIGLGILLVGLISFIIGRKTSYG